jgi:aminopeptidase
LLVNQSVISSSLIKGDSNRLTTDITGVAENNINELLTHVFKHAAPHKAVVVFDTRCELASTLTQAYRRCLPDAQFVDFDQYTPDAVLTVLAGLVASDLVVLVQSTNFRLEAFRIRVELFKRGLKVIEHPHLSRMVGAEVSYYIDALAYDPVYFRGVGNHLKSIIDQTQCGCLDSGGDQFPDARLMIGSAFESAKLNVGDYSGMQNVGGQFPIGEVFTEALDLEAVHGRVRIFAFGDTQYRVNRPAKPITLIVESGQVVTTEDSTPEFDAVLANIRADEQVVWLREIGFGLNRAFTKDRAVSDIGSYERMCGVHLSLGAKHGVYGKPNFKRGDGKYHIDVFAVTERVTLDEQVVYHDGAWRVGVE